MAIPGMISLGGGLPNPSLFPFKSLEFTVEDTKITLTDAELAAALQYSGSYGLDKLVTILKDHQQRVHNLPYQDKKDWHVMVSNGSQDALFKAFDVLLEPNHDSLIVENPTYSGALAALLPLGLNLVGIPVDENGMVVDELEKVLENWDTKYPGKRRPRVIYTIPTGQNPSGATLSASRREQLYKVASKYNLLILEDDPYWDLRFGGDDLKSLISMDTEGRVLRFDSFSKICSSGLRLGYATGPAPLIEKIQLHQQVSALHPSGISQMMLAKLLEHWGHEGFVRHTQKVKDFYRQKRDELLEALESEITPGYATWHVPSAGMFFWIKVEGIKDTTDLISQKAVHNKVLMVPGRSFQPEGLDSPHVRASFSTATKENLREATKRFNKLLTELHSE
eukprot:TRINITY_DN4843_c0_g1_i1.p1 TRINITY_DN4843_c0_g1~~TRINITY_DN4843_c0_g1_i1.p1  ORF type:complete len:394 (-),score=92.23 TRINITY_DN4843_c0_g1_i1:12-1193(-)